MDRLSASNGSIFCIIEGNGRKSVFDTFERFFTNLSLVEVVPVRRHLVIEIEPVLVLSWTPGLGEPVGLHLAVVVLHLEAQWFSLGSR